mmetsp:Transcript_42657/g.78869  ORF Transcript_42657/g.78869 Transcript_42657/m.78869 type:complete len:132 (-) Transcript_42657:883-1278(-)
MGINFCPVGHAGADHYHNPLPKVATDKSGRFHDVCVLHRVLGPLNLDGIAIRGVHAVVRREKSMFFDDGGALAGDGGDQTPVTDLSFHPAKNCAYGNGEEDLTVKTGFGPQCSWRSSTVVRDAMGNTLSIC